MKPCNKCFDNIWKFDELPDYWIQATCQMCGNELMWQEHWKIKKQEIKAGDVCRYCDVPLIKKSSKLTAKRLKRAYHYCFWFRCLECGRTYYTESAKTYPGTKCNCI